MANDKSDWLNDSEDDELPPASEVFDLSPNAKALPQELTIDPEVTVFAEPGSEDEDPLLKKITEDSASELAAGDLDAAWDTGNAGDESVGGTMPTPEQGNVDQIGESAGVEYQDTEELSMGEKLGKRDESRWELDPASSEDYEQRARELTQPNRSRRVDGA